MSGRHCAGVEAKFYRASKNAWQALNDEATMRKIEADYMDGMPQLSMKNKFTKYPDPDRHKYYVDFKTMKQIDWFFPRDSSHAKDVRRLCV